MERYSKEEYKSGQHALDEKQVKALLLTFDDIQEKAMIALAVAIGLRREDLVSIKKKDYDPQKKTILFMKRRRNVPEPFVYLHLKLYNSLPCILRPVEIRSGSFLHQRRQASTGLLTYPLVMCMTFLMSILIKQVSKDVLSTHYERHVTN